LRRLAPFLLVVAAALIAAPVTAADDAVIQHASTSPRQGFTDSVDGVSIEFKVSGSVPADVTITISGSGDEVRRIDLPGVQPGADRTVKWDGLTNGGRPVADGIYQVAVAVAGGNKKDAGSVELHRHFFPVRGPHGTRGPVGEFGAPRDGGRIHKGFDVTGACGTPLAAAVTGTVTRRGYDPRLDGNFVVIKGLGEPRQYLYAHMIHPSSFHRGDFVHVGQIVGHIGKTGNARTTVCHLHFEIHLRGRPINPKPYLRAWDRFS
jgi:murein DD-endopeptidase MepM/ murein hydrolase activator NlpD